MLLLMTGNGSGSSGNESESGSGWGGPSLNRFRLCRPLAELWEIPSILSGPYGLHLHLHSIRFIHNFDAGNLWKKAKKRTGVIWLPISVPCFARKTNLLRPACAALRAQVCAVLPSSTPPTNLHFVHDKLADQGQLTL